MKKNEVVGRVVPVRITGESRYGGPLSLTPRGRAIRVVV